MSTSRDVARVKRKLGENADRLLRGLALEATKRIVMRTPVDTGRARGNWNVSIGSVDQSTTERTDPAGTVTISQAGAKLRGAKFGDVIYISNGLPYIRRLEYGWSDQAPNGMVRLVAAELQPIADQIARRVRSGLGR